MPKALLNQAPKSSPFGVLPLVISRRIDDSDRCSALDAANYRYTAAMRELEQQFETAACKLRRAYIDEVVLSNCESEES